MGLDSGTQEYMFREELQRGKLRGMRAWRFEKRLREGRGESWQESVWRN